MKSLYRCGRYRSSGSAVAVTLVVATAVTLVVGCQSHGPTASTASARGRSLDPVRTDINLSGPFLENPDGKDPHDPEAYQRCGEPMIAKDVLRPENLTVICMGVRGLNYQSPQPRVDWEFVDVTRSRGRAVDPVFVSNDGGTSWRRVLPDPLSSKHMLTDRDPVAAYGPKGEIYLAADAIARPVDGKHGPVLVTPGLAPDETLGTGFARSLDGGKTWGEAIVLPTPGGPRQMVVDQSTGVIYTASTCANTTTIGVFGCTPGGRVLAVSRDQGRTWDPAVDIRNKEPPSATRTPGRLYTIGGGSFAAAHGVFAIVKPAAPPAAAAPGAAPAGGGGFVVRFSTDQGGTFSEERPLPLGGCRPGRMVADPGHRGGFAVLASCGGTANEKQWWVATPSVLRVFVTRDMGVTWKQSGDLSVPPPPGYVLDPNAWKGSPTDAPPGTLVKPLPTIFYIGLTAIDYGPTGALGVAWLQTYGPAATPIPPAERLVPFAPFRNPQPNGPRDFFVALSPDGGVTFDKPMRVNTKASPPMDPREHDGNEYTGIVLDRNFAYTVWPDWRSGEMQTWFRKIPLPGGS